MLNSPFERRREISIFSSVGLNPAQISAIFVAEASLTGFIAGGLGYLLGLGAYRLMGVVGLSLEVHQKVSAFWSLASIGIAISAVLVGATLALKSSVVITPSLTRRWRLEERDAKINQVWTTIIPVKLMRKQVDDFTEFIMKALGRLENDPVRMISLLKIERSDGRIKISFVHKSTQSISGSFYTKNTLSIWLGPNDEYVVELESAGDMGMTHATGSMLRMLTMEWSTKAKI
jgi:ABC-type antimicrobial peptide transport system permease subunit